MKKPAEFWNQSYSKDIGFEELVTDKPSNAIEKFANYLRSRRVPLQGRLLDVGCGMGRNANWLARQGFNVTGVDISSVAIDEAGKRAQKLGLSVDYHVTDISTKLPFEDNSMDFIVDIVTSQLLTSGELKKYREEIIRVLKPGGMFLLYNLDRSVDKEAQKLVKEHPGPEENTYIIPQNNLFERVFTSDEIRDIWLPLNIEHLELLHIPTVFKGETYWRFFWWVIFRKPNEKGS